MWIIPNCNYFAGSGALYPHKTSITVASHSPADSREIQFYIWPGEPAAHRFWSRSVKSPPHWPAKAHYIWRWMDDLDFQQHETALIKYLTFYMPEVHALLLSPFGRYSLSQVGIVWEKKKKKNWNAKGNWRGWHRKVKCPLQGIQEMGNSAKFLPIFSTATCCLSAWTSHLAFPWLVLHCASGAQLHGVHGSYI